MNSLVHYSFTEVEVEVEQEGSISAAYLIPNAMHHIIIHPKAPQNQTQIGKSANHQIIERPPDITPSLHPIFHSLHSEMSFRSYFFPPTRPEKNSFPRSANPFSGFPSSTTALSHLVLSRFATSISFSLGLKTFAAPPRPTCVLFVDSRRGWLRVEC